MEIRIRRAVAAFGFGAVVLGVTGFAIPAEPPAPAETARLPKSSLTTAMPIETTPPSETYAAATTEPAAQPEPYPVECLEGTPGPAIWSDGTTRYSQWCFDTRGGRENAEAESQSGADPYGRGYRCDANGCVWPDGSPVIGADRCGRRCGEPPTSGDIQGDWAQCIAVKTTEQCRAELNDN